MLFQWRKQQQQQEEEEEEGETKVKVVDDHNNEENVVMAINNDNSAAWDNKKEEPLVHSPLSPCATATSSSAAAPHNDESSLLAQESTLSTTVVAIIAKDEPESTTAQPPQPVPSSWEEALHRACLVEQCLTRTPHQVLQEQTRILLPPLDGVIIYNKNDDPLTTAKRIVQQMHKSNKSNNNNNNKSTTTNSWSRRMVSGLSWTVSKIYEQVLGDADDSYYDQEQVTFNEPDDFCSHQQQDEEEDDENAITTIPKLVSSLWEEPVVCVPLVQECVDDLISRCTTDPSSSLSLLALNRDGTGDFSFGQWTGYPYNSHDLTLLEHVLVQTGHAIFVQDYIVFLRKNTTTNPTTTTINQRDVDVAVALLQLQQGLADTQRQLFEWTERAEECTRRAATLYFKTRHVQKSSAAAAAADNKNNTAAALHELQKRKLLQTKVDHARALVLNLQQAYDTLEMAHLQRSHVLLPLQATARALRALRQDQEHSVENVEDLFHDLKDEYEHHHWNNVALLTNDLNDEYDDEMLMQELERLSVNDDALTKQENKNDKAVKEVLLSDSGTPPTIEPENQIEPVAVKSRQQVLRQQDEDKTSDMALLQ